MDDGAVTLQVDATFGRGGFSRHAAFEVAPGAVLGLVGANGSGKSTLLHTIAGIDRVRSGRIVLDGQVLDDGTEFVEPQDRRCVVVFQDLRLFPAMSVLDNVAYGPRSHGAPKTDAHARAREALAKVGLAGFEGRRPDGLSGGERQRVAIARAVVTNPAVLLLDEPFASVDADSRPGLREVLRGVLAGSEARTVIVSHDPADIADLAATVVRL
jgi:molybdate transport system ATP-binding protein